MPILVNIIANNNQYGLTNDAIIFVRELQNLMGSDRFQVRSLPPFATESSKVDINVFFEIPNPLLCHFAKINILIPNNEWFFKTWTPYLEWFDYIFCKTETAFNLFTSLVNNEWIIKTQIVKTGWTSLDRWDSVQHQPNDKYRKYVHIMGCSPFKGTIDMVNNWKDHWPELNIYYNHQKLDVLKKISTEKSQQTNIVWNKNRLKDEELKRVMNSSGVHLCLSEAEGFGHYLNEARSCQSLVVSVDSDPMNTFCSHVIEIDTQKTVEFPHTLGRRVYMSNNDFNTKMESLFNEPVDNLSKIGSNQRINYLNDQKQFRSVLSKTWKRVLHSLENDEGYIEKIPLEMRENVDDLPHISIVTITKNRRKFFPLAIMNYLGIDYPRNRLEWIVIDDSDIDDRVDDLIQKEKVENVNYTFLDTPLSIAAKRDLGVSKSKYDIIAMMDDDDIYFPRNILLRYSYLKFYQKSCCYCSSIGCFHIKKIISSINVPPIQYPPELRISEATLCFKKSFWKTRGFSDKNNPDKTGDEGETFLKDRYHECVEMPWRDIIVSLLHSKNTSNRITVGNEPNGCHFGLSDSLFNWITTLDE